MTVMGQVSKKQYQKDKLVITLKNIHFMESSHLDIKKQDQSNQDIPHLIQTNQEQTSQIQIKQVQSNQTQTNQIPTNGGALCYSAIIQGVKEPPMGSQIFVQGKIALFTNATNPGEFDSKEYYEIMGVHFKLMNAVILPSSADHSNQKRVREWLYQVRINLEGTYEKVLTPKTASIVKAMVLGNKKEIDSDIKELYQENGIAHILAISGLHISMIGIGLYKVLRKGNLGIPFAASISMVFLYAYGIMTDMSASSSRAIVMFTIFLLGDIVKRSYDMLTSMAIACVIILVQQPLYVFYSGFQLSFGAIMGIGLCFPILDMLWKTQKGFRGKLRASVLISMSVNLFTLPVLLMGFFEYPTYSILLNLLVIPLMGLLIAGALAVLPLSLFGNVIVSLATIPCEVILAVYEILCRVTIKLPFYSLPIGKPELWQIICYEAILLFVILFYKKIPKYAVYLGLVTAIVSISVSLKTGLTVTMLDVGQGDCFIIETENRTTFMIDGGSSSKKNIGKYQLIPFLKSQGIREIDYAIITHMDKDHTSGIQEMLSEEEQSKIKIKQIVMAKVQQENEKSQELLQTIQRANIPILWMEQGDTLKEGEFSMTCLHPEGDFKIEEENESSLVLQLSYRKFDMLFTGDVEGGGEAALTKELNRLLYAGKLPSVEILKVSHHGSNNATLIPLLEIVKPAEAFISAGRKNSYGHPHPMLLQRLRERNIKSYETAKNGAITLWTDGKTYKIKEYFKK